MVNIIKVIIVTISYVFFATSANAAIFSIYTDRTAFEAALSSSTTETFNSTVADASFDGAVIDYGDFDLSAENTGVRNLIDALPVQGSGTDIDGTSFLSYFLNASEATITFDTPITAVGFDIFAFGNIGNVSSLTILDGIFDQTDIISSLSFFGVTSDTAFTTLTFKSLINDGFSVDNLVYGQVSVVSAPATLMLMLITIGIIAQGKRKRV